MVKLLKKSQVLHHGVPHINQNLILMNQKDSKFNERRKEDIYHQKGRYIPLEKSQQIIDELKIT